MLWKHSKYAVYQLHGLYMCYTIIKIIELKLNKYFYIFYALNVFFHFWFNIYIFRKFNV